MAKAPYLIEKGSSLRRNGCCGSVVAADPRFVLTGQVGTNSDLLADAFKLFVPTGVTVADVTYGRGNFWVGLDQTQYRVLKSDISPKTPDTVQADFRALPYPDNSVDVVLLDPPYAHGGQTMKKSITMPYGQSIGNHRDVIQQYSDGIREAARVLQKRGLAMVKCQDEIESGKQRWSHIEIKEVLEDNGFQLEDMLTLVQKTQPAMRVDYQKHARKNHSYLWVARLR